MGVVSIQIIEAFLTRHLAIIAKDLAIDVIRRHMEFQIGKLVRIVTVTDRISHSRENLHFVVVSSGCDSDKCQCRTDVPVYSGNV